MSISKKIELSDAIDRGLATLGHNDRPEGWRYASFQGLFAWVAPDAPEINGEITDEEDYRDSCAP